MKKEVIYARGSVFCKRAKIFTSLCPQCLLWNLSYSALQCSPTPGWASFLVCCQHWHYQELWPNSVWISEHNQFTPILVFSHNIPCSCIPNDNTNLSYCNKQSWATLKLKEIVKKMFYPIVCLNFPEKTFFLFQSFCKLKCVWEKNQNSSCC